MYMGNNELILLPVEIILMVHLLWSKTKSWKTYKWKSKRKEKEITIENLSNFTLVVV